MPLPEQSAIDAKKDTGPTSRVVMSAGGSVDVMNEGGSRRRLYSISWESASLEYSSDQKFGGKMKNVKGSTYTEDGAVASTFVANEAQADKGTNTLHLTGGIKLVSRQYGSLYCEELAYDGVKGVIEAKGKIEAEDKTYLVRGVDHVIAKSDLSVIATPDMFEVSK